MVQVHQIACVEPWFEPICNGSKRIDGRCGEKYASVAPGDIIRFTCKSNDIHMRVKRVAHYSSFAQLLHVEGLTLVLPGVKTIEDGVKVYRRFYSLEFESKGVYAFELQCVAK